MDKAESLVQKMIDLGLVVESTNFFLRPYIKMGDFSAYLTASVSLQFKKTSSNSHSQLHSLYHRISLARNPMVSIVPILDQWVNGRRTLDRDKLHYIIKELKFNKRYKHALQVSKWMTNARYFDITCSDAAIQLDLISKVHGIESAETYLNNTPKNLKGVQIYDALLNCYKKTGNYKKLDTLMREMETNNIAFDKSTYLICMNAYAANSDIERMESTLEKMKSDSQCTPDWEIYAVVASLYTKAGMFDKALVMLKKSEGLVTCPKRNIAYDFLLTQYAKAGSKDEVFRLWGVYKREEKILNKGYKSMIGALFKLDDIEGAEKIFEEWETQNLNYDIRVPNFLIGAYAKKGLMESAENLVNRVILKGGKPNEWTWYNLIKGHIRNDDTLKAVEAMKEAIKVCELRQKPSDRVFATCFNFLKKEGKVDGLVEFIRLLGEHNIISIDVQSRLLNYVNDQTGEINVFTELCGKKEKKEFSDFMNPSGFCLTFERSFC